jgi:glycosyltransferase involved in cell wall biosynthesis
MAATREVRSPSGEKPGNFHLLKVAMGLDPREGGPTEVVVASTLGELEAGIAVTLVSPSTGSAGEARNADTLRSAGATVVLFPLVGRQNRVARRWAVSPACLAWLWKHVRRFDAIHIHGAWGFLPLGAAVFARVRRVPLVLTAHEALTDYDIRQTPRRALVPLKFIGRKVFLGLVDALVVSSELELRDTTRTKACVYCLPHPVALSPGRRVQRRRSNRVVGFIGRFHAKKNLPLLIEAIGALQDDVRLVVAGSGEADAVRQAMECVEAFGLTHRVTWLGWLEPDERLDFYEQVDVLAVPSSYECYGMVAAEAMTLGIPIVVTPTTGAAELVSESGGGLIAPQSVEGFAQALGSILESNDTARAAGERAAAFAEYRLMPISYGRTVLEIYRELCPR